MIQSVEKLKNGRFYYSPNQTEPVYILRTGNQQIDYIQGVQLTSKVVWINPTVYKLILENISNPEQIDLKIGDELYVSIKEITTDYYLTETKYNGAVKESKLWFAAA